MLRGAGSTGELAGLGERPIIVFARRLGMIRLLTLSGGVSRAASSSSLADFRNASTPVASTGNAFFNLFKSDSS